MSEIICATTKETLASITSCTVLLIIVFLFADEQCFSVEYAEVDGLWSFHRMSFDQFPACEKHPTYYRAVKFVKKHKEATK